MIGDMGFPEVERAWAVRRMSSSLSPVARSKTATKPLSLMVQSQEPRLLPRPSPSTRHEIKAPRPSGASKAQETHLKNNILSDEFGADERGGGCSKMC